MKTMKTVPTNKINPALARIEKELRALEYGKALDGCLYRSVHDTYGEPRGFPFGFLIRHIVAFQAGRDMQYGAVEHSDLRAHVRKTYRLLAMVDAELRSYGFPEGDGTDPRPLDLAEMLS